MTTIATVPSTAPNTATIVLTKRDMEARVDSRQLAEHLGLEHASVFKLIKEHRASLESFGKVGFQIGASPGSITGQRMRFALLNEGQACLLLTMSRNTPRVVEFKKALVKAFLDNRMALAAYREATLPSTKALQDAIKAVPGGPGPWLYSNIAKLVNFTADMGAGARAAGDTLKQATLTLMQTIATQAVRQATDAKDAYYRVKEALQPFEVLADTEVVA